MVYVSSNLFLPRVRPQKPALFSFSHSDDQVMKVPVADRRCDWLSPGPSFAPAGCTRAVCVYPPYCSCSVWMRRWRRRRRRTQSACSRMSAPLCSYCGHTTLQGLLTDSELHDEDQK
uniref:Uncharacterized protein n=1 Tax=Knipowitschia caucasica TaxID=637954 RepID=A0AAV2M6F7_KNICA